MNVLEGLGQAIDELVAAFAPAWGLSRSQARAARAQLAAFHRGATSSRVDGRTVTGRGMGADSVLEQALDRRESVDRARQLERDSVIAQTLLDISSESVVGATGPRPQAQTADPNWNRLAESLWKGWAENPAACDSRGISTFGELVLLGFRSTLRDGDHGAVKLGTGRLRMFEADELGDPFGPMPESNRVDGIELDPAGRPTSFWLVQGSPTVRYGAASYAQVPAEHVIFQARRQRLGQTRGLTAFSSIAWLLDQIDGNVESVTVAARMAACFGLVVKRKGGLGNLPQSTGPDGVARKKLRLEPGSFYELEPGEELSQIDPRQPAQDFPAFIRALCRLVALAFGLPLEVAFLDFSATSFASARGALLQAWNRWRCYQAMVKKFATAVYVWKIVEWIESGQLPYRADALAHRWMLPGWQWLDPEAEIRASLAAVDAGFDTLSDVAMRGGKDLDELIAQRKLEREKMAAAGIPEVRSTITRDPNVPTTAPDARDLEREKKARAA